MGLVPETLVIFNAASRRGDALAAQLQPHAAGGDGLRWVSLAELDGLNAQPERVVAVGGDGTVNAVASWLRKTGHRCPMGMVPGGTGNNLFRGLGLPEPPEQALRLALTARPVTRKLDLIRYHGAGAVATRLIVQAGAIGFPADVAARYDSLRARPTFRRALRPLGGNAYRLLALGRLLGQLHPAKRAARLEVRLPNETFEAQILALFIGNERSLGGHFIPCPHARVDDGLLDLCLVRAGSLLSTVRLFQLISRGEHLQHSDAVLYRQSAGPVELHLDRAVPMVADGDLWVRSDRFTLEVLPAACDLVVAAGGEPENTTEDG